MERLITNSAVWGKRLKLLHLISGNQRLLSAYEIRKVGISLVVQWLRLCTVNAGVQVLFLIRELRSHMLHGAAKKIKKKKKKKKINYYQVLFPSQFIKNRVDLEVRVS